MADNPTDKFFRLRLEQLPTTPTKEKGVFEDLMSVYNAVRTLADQVAIQLGLVPWPSDFRSIDFAAATTGFAARRIYAPADETISEGNLVNFFDDAGTVKVRLASATDDTRPAHGIAFANAAIGATAEVIMGNQYLRLITGMTPGVIYYLSIVDGAIQNAPPSASGNLVQAIGLALADDGIWMNISYQTQVVP